MSALAHAWEFVLFAGAVQGLILAVFLFTHRKGNQPANMVLGLLMVALAFDLLTAIPAAGTALPLGLVAFLYAPLLYMYTHVLLQREPEKYRSFVTAVIPVYAVPLLLYGLTYFARFSQAVTMDAPGLSDATFVPLVTPSPVAAVLLSLTSTVFLALSSRALSGAARFATDAFSSDAVLQVRWLRTVHVVALVLFGALLAGTLLTALTILPPGPVGIALRVSLAALVFTIGFYGLKHPAVFSGSETEALDLAGANGTQQAPADDPRLSAVKELLLESMAGKKPYLDPGLTIRGLSEQLGVGHRTVSKALNDSIGQTFFEFVNRYRAESARTMLADTANAGKTVIGIAYESGFSSKSVFNAAFRKCAGMTPTEYRRMALGQATRGCTDR